MIRQEIFLSERILDLPNHPNSGNDAHRVQYCVKELFYQLAEDRQQKPFFD